MTEFNIDYFLEKFQTIPTHDIGEGDIKKHCALFHCGVVSYMNPTDEASALSNIIRPLFKSIPYSDPLAMIYFINDGTCSGHWIDADEHYNSPLQQKMNSMLPKERIIFCLQILKFISTHPEIPISDSIDYFTNLNIQK